MHNYCTYFDSNSLPKGLSLIHSLQKYDPESTIYVVCLDVQTLQILETLAMPWVRFMPLQLIERKFACLDEAQKNRSKTEYCCTLTPVIIEYLLQGLPDDTPLLYVDADLYFFSAPDPIHETMQNASVLIHGHNFTESQIQLEVYGKYNVGLVGFRNNSEGRKVLAWWKERCLEYTGKSIVETPDGLSRFGDQKYLDYFAEISPEVQVAHHAGIGVGPWNVARYSLGQTADGSPLVDNTLVVFYHYHSFAVMAEACYSPALNGYNLSVEALRLFAVPYISALKNAYKILRTIDPKFNGGLSPDAVQRGGIFLVGAQQLPLYDTLEKTATPLHYNRKDGLWLVRVSKEQKGRKHLEWTGDYPDWNSAVIAAGDGYAAESILKKCCAATRAVYEGKALWERDSVLFHHEAVNWPVLSGLMHAAAVSGGKLHVLDFGGSLGGTCLQHRRWLESLPEWSWNVVEQSHFVECGKKEFQTEHVRFFSTVDEALNAAPANVILLSGVLQYLENSYALLEQLCKLPVDWLIIDRTPLLEKQERITVQHVPPSIYKASYPCRLLNKLKLVEILQANHHLSPWFQSDVDPKGFEGVIATRKIAIG